MCCMNSTVLVQAVHVRQPQQYNVQAAHKRNTVQVSANETFVCLVLGTVAFRKASKDSLD